MPRHSSNRQCGPSRTLTLPAQNPWSEWEFNRDTRIFQRSREVADNVGAWLGVGGTRYEWEYYQPVPYREADGVPGWYGENGGPSRQGNADEENDADDEYENDSSSEDEEIIEPPSSVHNEVNPYSAIASAQRTPYTFGRVTAASRHLSFLVGDNNSDLRDQRLPVYTEYQKHSPPYFKLMRVFKMLAREPEHVDDDTPSRGSNYGYVRHFIIVQRKEDHCLCLPIYMYSQHNPEVNVAQHGKIHSKRRNPNTEQVEVHLRRLTVRMEPSYTDRDRLNDWARVDYTKLFAVKYDVQSSFVGEIDERHHGTVVDNYNNSIEEQAAEARSIIYEREHEPQIFQFDDL